MKAVITNPSRQHAQIHYWRATLGGDKRMDYWTVPFGQSIEIDVPISKEDDQKAHVAEQCKALGLSFKEGTL